MNKKTCIVITLVTILVVLVILLWLFFSLTPAGVQSGTPENEAHTSEHTEEVVSNKLVNKQSTDSLNSEILAEAEAAGLSSEKLEQIQGGIDKVALMAQVFSYPIEFYGKVVDLNNAPIPNAEVTYSAFNKFFENAEQHQTFSDENGLIIIKDIQGGSLFVRVAKEGYYQIDDSKKKFGYAVPGDYPAAANPNNPAILKLLKRGEAEYLVHYQSGWNLQRDETPMGIDLLEGIPNKKQKSIPYDSGHLIIRGWSPEPEDKRDPENPRTNWRYPWKFKITAPGGGFIERTDKYAFIAPETGYVESLTFEMPEGVETWEEWHHGVRKEVFAKLHDGNYARLYFEYRTGTKTTGDTFRIEAYTNPNGSRNLEYDPNVGTTQRHR